MTQGKGTARICVDALESVLEEVGTLISNRDYAGAEDLLLGAVNDSHFYNLKERICDSIHCGLGFVSSVCQLIDYLQSNDPTQIELGYRNVKLYAAQTHVGHEDDK